MNKKLITTIMDKICKKTFLFIVTIIITIAFTSCNSDDDDVNFQGVNIVGMWIMTDLGDRNYYGDDYIDTSELYMIKADGTIDRYVYNYDDKCDCDRTMTNGILNCSLDHYTFEYRYKYSIEDNYMYLSDIGLKFISKTSNDEFTMDSPWWENYDVILNRVKGFAQ